jgi:hypothetical protein
MIINKIDKGMIINSIKHKIIINNSITNKYDNETNIINIVVNNDSYLLSFIIIGLLNNNNIIK